MSIKKEELLPQTFDINVLDTDTLFDNSPPMGTDECTCSRCGEVINETPIRAWPKEDVDRIGYEYRFHQKCILDELNNIVKNN